MCCIFISVNILMLMFLAYFFMYLTNVRAYSRPILGSTIERWPFCKHAKGGFFETLFSKRCLFHKKMLFLININCCPKFLEYALHVLKILYNFWGFPTIRATQKNNLYKHWMLRYSCIADKKFRNKLLNNATEKTIY